MSWSFQSLIKKIKKVDPKPAGLVLITLLLLLLTGVLRSKPNENELLAAVRFLFVFTIYIVMLAAWGLSLWQRMLQSHIRSYLLGIAALMLFWILVRTFKHRPFEFIEPVSRWLWYCYYIPMILIPLFSVFVALCLGKPESWRPRRRANLLFIPATLLLCAILTNDLHQLAFAFPSGIELWDTHYTYQILYYLTALWMATCFLGVLWLLLKKSLNPGTKKPVLLPLFTMGLVVLYTALYATSGGAKTGVGFIEMTAALLALTVGIWESCILTGLLPSNTKYSSFFDLSPLAAQIVDEKGTVHYRSRLAEPISFATFEALRVKGELEEGPDCVLHAAPIRGGYVVFREDVARLTAMIDELRKIETELLEGVAILREEFDAKSRQLHVDEQNRLYDLTVRQIMPQIQTIKSYLDAADKADKSTKWQLLWKVSVLGAYIKRRSNLILLSEGFNTVSMDDLARCFCESFENLKIGAVQCSLTVEIDCALPPAYAILFYDFFQAVIENALSSLYRLSATLSCNRDDFSLTLEIAGGLKFDNPLATRRPENEIRALGGRVAYKAPQQDVSHLKLYLPKGGLGQ